MRSAFDIIGPIMIGPSSSHTAGAVRLGLMARAILAEEVKSADIKLHGSFAQTYKGHGTDRALIAGIMGFKPDDERIRDALQLATKNNIEYNFTKVNLEDAHPNTAIINLTGVSGRTVSLQGASIGGGNILVTEINGLEVAVSGQYNTLLVLHHDKPGAIAAVTNFMAYSDINIGNFRLSRPQKGGVAIMTIEVDGSVSQQLIDSLKVLPSVINVILIRVV